MKRRKDNIFKNLCEEKCSIKKKEKSKFLNTDLLKNNWECEKFSYFVKSRVHRETRRHAAHLSVVQKVMSQVLFSFIT